MSLSFSAPEFKPSLPLYFAALVEEPSVPTNHYVIDIPKLGYEFPYTMKAMPLPTFAQGNPKKCIWKEMITSVSSYLKRY